MALIKYIGARETYREGAYGSGIVFSRGETVSVEDEVLARKLLRHADVYVPGDVGGDVPVATQKAADADDEDPQQDAKDMIANMDKNSLVTYAKTNFNVDFDKRKSVNEMRSQIGMLLDQYGAA